jgi:hypothetical protein
MFLAKQEEKRAYGECTVAEKLGKLRISLKVSEVRSLLRQHEILQINAFYYS